jgi:hypothetical protein
MPATGAQSATNWPNGQPRGPLPNVIRHESWRDRAIELPALPPIQTNQLNEPKLAGRPARQRPDGAATVPLVWLSAGHCSGPPSQRRLVVDPGGMCPRPSECLLGLDRVECDRTAQQQFAHNTRRGAARPRRGRRGTWSCAVGRSGGAASSATITPSTSSTQTSTRLRHRSRPAYNMAKGTSSVRAHR